MMDFDYLKCCDNVQFMRSLCDNCIDLTVTSPPYDNLRKYNGFSWDFKSVADELYRITKDGGVVVWIVNDSTVNGGETLSSFKQALYFTEIGFRLYDTMIWEKPSPACPTQDRYYDVFEYMFVFSKGKPKAINLIEDRQNKSCGSSFRKQTRSCREDRKYKKEKGVIKPVGRRFNVWSVSRGMNKTSHPAVFPEQLANDHIISWSNEGDVVFDPFVGSGTTAKMAMLNNRHYIGCDISQEYIDIATKRLNECKK